MKIFCETLSQVKRTCKYRNKVDVKRTKNATYTLLQNDLEKCSEDYPVYSVYTQHIQGSFLGVFAIIPYQGSVFAYFHVFFYRFIPILNEICIKFFRGRVILCSNFM